MDTERSTLPSRKTVTDEGVAASGSGRRGSVTSLDCGVRTGSWSWDLPVNRVRVTASGEGQMMGQ